MNNPNEYPFLNTLKQLWEQEELFLFSKIYETTTIEEELIVQFLKSIYVKEALEYPYRAPEFDQNAALWGAKSFYVASQLLLNRESSAEEGEALFPLFKGTKDAAAILSADLFLRFLPIIVEEASRINPEDELISILDKILFEWHYSGIGFVNKESALNFNAVVENNCLHQLYVNRVIDKNVKDLMEHEALKEWIGASRHFSS